MIQDGSLTQAYNNIWRSTYLLRNVDRSHRAPIILNKPRFYEEIDASRVNMLALFNEMRRIAPYTHRVYGYSTSVDMVRGERRVVTPQGYEKLRIYFEGIVR